MKVNHSLFIYQNNLTGITDLYRGCQLQSDSLYFTSKNKTDKEDIKQLKKDIAEAVRAAKLLKTGDLIFSDRGEPTVIIQRKKHNYILTIQLSGKNIEIKIPVKINGKTEFPESLNNTEDLKNIKTRVEKIISSGFRSNIDKHLCGCPH